MEHDPDRAGPTPIFVVGMPRSGTTWVQRLLASQPRAWALLETYMFSRQIGLGALLRSLPAPEQGGGEFDLPPAGLGRIFAREELVEELRRVALRWLGRASHAGALYVVEKSPWHLSDVDLIGEILPAARFVHVVRDGRDVTVSLAAARRSWASEGAPSTRETVREAARLWTRAIEKGELADVLLADRLLELRYEELHADPRPACGKLFEHCGLPADDQSVDRALEATDFDRQDAARGEDRALRAGRVGDWRERFGVADAWAFERIAGEALEVTGYETDRGWWRRRPLRSRL